MSNSWDKWSEQVREWVRTLADKAGIFTQAAASKAEELSKVGRLKVDIFQIQRELNRLYADLGLISYQTLEGKRDSSLESQPEVEELRRRIASMVKNIAAKEKEIEAAATAEKERAARAKPKPTPEAAPEAAEPAPKPEPAPVKKAASGGKRATAGKSAGGTKKKSTAAAKKPSSGTAQKAAATKKQ